MGLCDTSGSVAHSACYRPTRNRGARDAINISSNTKPIDDALGFKLIREVFAVNKVSSNTLVGLEIVKNFNIGNGAL